MIKKYLKYVVILLLLLGLWWGLAYWNLLPQRYYTAQDFGIETIKSQVDYNSNGVDDYTDILLGAREDAKNKPKYDGAYVQGGYPDADKGVCTDVVWRAFRQAGYSLKDMIDRDIAANPDAYPRTGGEPDPNIDFRRVPNLQVFFSRYGVSLTLDPGEIEQWQPGDIVTYSNTHIAIVSDRRNRDGVPYIIHNGGQPKREEDALTRHKISGHYRFDASLVKPEILTPFKEG